MEEEIIVACEVQEIDISGHTHVVIKPGNYEGELCIFTHANTSVEFIGNALVIKDPPNQQPKLSRKRRLSKDYADICISFDSSETNGKRMVFNNTEIVKETECQTKHIIECVYDRVTKISSKGSIRSTIMIPLDYSDSEIKLEDDGHLRFIEAQKFTDLFVSLIGDGSIFFKQADIESISVVLTGDGDLDLGNSQIETTSIKVTGTGSVANFTTRETASLNLVGKGTIKCIASPNAEIKHAKIGAGSIKVKRLAQ